MGRGSSNSRGFFLRYDSTRDWVTEPAGKCHKNIVRVRDMGKDATVGPRPCRSDLWAKRRCDASIRDRGVLIETRHAYAAARFARCASDKTSKGPPAFFGQFVTPQKTCPAQCQKAGRSVRGRPAGEHYRSGFSFRGQGLIAWPGLVGFGFFIWCRAPAAW